MRTLTILLSIALFSNCFGQAIDSSLLEHKKFIYSIDEACLDTLEWDELHLPDKKVSEKINKVIRKAMLSKQCDTTELQMICDDTKLPSNEKKNWNYNAAFTITYLANNILSCIISESKYLGGPYPNERFSTFNFDLTTGNQFDICDLIIKNNIPIMDSLCIEKINQKLNAQTPYRYYYIFGLQMNYVYFSINESGITLGIQQLGSIPFLTANFTFGELKPFMKRNGPLKKIYQNKF